MGLRSGKLLNGLVNKLYGLVSDCIENDLKGVEGLLEQKANTKHMYFSLQRHAAVLEKKIKSKGADRIPEHPARRSFNVKECKSREPGMTVFKVTEHKSDKQVVKAANKTGQKSAGSKTKYSKVTKRIIDEPQEMRMVLRNQDLENPRRSTRLSDKCGGRWKEMKERNEDRKKRSDLLRKKLRDQHEMLREKQKKTETGLKKSVAITTKDKGTTLKFRKTNSNKVEDNIGQDSNESIANRLRGGKEKVRKIGPDKLADLEKKRTVKNSKTNLGSKTKFNKDEGNKTQENNENIANRLRGGKEMTKEVVSDKTLVINKSLTINQMPEIRFKDAIPGTDKKVAEKPDKKLLDTTDAVLSEHQKKLESQRALVRQHAFFGSLKWKKGSCGYCLACRRDTNCGKCRHCKVCSFFLRGRWRGLLWKSVFGVSIMKDKNQPAQLQRLARVLETHV